MGLVYSDISPLSKEEVKFSIHSNVGEVVVVVRTWIKEMIWRWVAQNQQAIK